MARKTQIALCALVALAAPARAADKPEFIKERCILELFCVQERYFRETVEFWVESKINDGFTIDLIFRPNGDTGGSEDHEVLAVKSRGTEEIVEQKISRTGSGYSWDIDWILDDRTRRHNPRDAYRLPFPAGTRLQVAQSIRGPDTYKPPYRYALDFLVPAGTPVLAARDGRVILAADDFTEGGGEIMPLGQRERRLLGRVRPGADAELYRDKSNMLIIRHDDGTIAHYLHLAPDSIKVEVGDRVKAGDEIAASGQTGWAPEPELGFYVATAASRNTAFKTFQLKFDTGQKRPEALDAGALYLAP